MSDNSALFSLAGRRALITGSGQGIGLRLARGLAAAGASIVLNDVDAGRLERAVAELRAEKIAAAGALFHVARPAEVGPAIAEVERQGGPIDLLVNNAGIHRYAALADMELARWQEVLDVNLTGAFVVAQAVARRMIARAAAGKIINICSLMSEAASTDDRQLRRGEGRPEAPDEGHGGRMGPPWHPGQWHRSRLHPDGPDPASRSATGIRCLGQGPHPGGPLGHP